MYTLSDTPHPHLKLFRVERDGQPTEAWAAKGVYFDGSCEVYAGQFFGGKFCGGTFRGGTFLGGTFLGGEFRGGSFGGGEYHDGQFYAGRFLGGRFYGGMFRGGLFWKGAFHGGSFHGGTFYNGTFRIGLFRGGAFWSGEFNGGDFLVGEFREGWLPLQIQGSQHPLNIPDGCHIRIGCQEMTPEQWRNEYQLVGKRNEYTPAQIEEYRAYIEVAARMIEAAEESA